MADKEAPYTLCFDVLKRLSQAGVLNDLILVGSWCVYFYKQHYAKGTTAYGLRTTDVDFLVSLPPKIHHPTNVQKLLADLGFRENFSSQGFMRLVHPELTIDFLVPWHGRGEGKPYLIKTLSISATPLRFVDLLLLRRFHVKTEGLTLTLPHPACFAFQKLLISGRRKYPDKAAKDRAQALDVLDMVVHQEDQAVAKHDFKTLPASWQKTILKEMDRAPATPGSKIPELKTYLES